MVQSALIEGLEMAHVIIREFETAQDARNYRHEHGTGGWIFEVKSAESNRLPYPSGTAWLFPPHMTPSHIFHHPLTSGMTGNLIGSM